MDLNDTLLLAGIALLAGLAIGLVIGGGLGLSSANAALDRLRVEVLRSNAEIQDAISQKCDAKEHHRQVLQRLTIQDTGLALIHDLLRPKVRLAAAPKRKGPR